MNDRLINARFSLSLKIRDIRMEMDKLAGDGSDSDNVNPPMPTPYQDSTPLFARKEERATSRLSSGNCGNHPLKRDVERPGARLK